MRLPGRHRCVAVSKHVLDLVTPLPPPLLPPQEHFARPDLLRNSAENAGWSLVLWIIHVKCIMPV